MPRKFAALLLCLLVLPSAAAAQTDYGRIAYTSDRDGNDEIYSARLDAPGETNLTRNPAIDQSPAWSADGSQIAFVSDRDGRMDIWAMNWDGTNQHKVTSGDPTSGDYEPTWSPDGSEIAFRSTRGGGSHIWILDVATGAVHQLTAETSDAPAWSPDGSRIAYDGGGEIRVIDATGANDHQLTYCDCTGPAGSPTWSRDGSFLIFGRYDDDWQTTNVRRLYYVSADGGQGIPVTTGAYHYDHPAFSPDGSLLLFQRQDGAFGDPELYVMPLSGTSESPFVTGPGRNFVPAWGVTFVPPAPPPPPPDTTPPTITITRPTANTDRIDVYTLGQVALAEYSCADAQSGIRHCDGPVPSGSPIDTTSIGTFNFVVFAADQAGNPVYARTKYRVIYDFAGFASPIVNSGFTDAKAGNGIPFKFSLHGVDRLDAVVTVTQRSIDCTTHADLGIAAGADGTLTYNASLDRFLFDWATSKQWAGSCRTVTFALRDGTQHSADIRFAK